jgi:hypothetical protein
MPSTVTSDTQICNNALLRLGAGTIASMLDNTVLANACNQLYSPTRDSLLRQHFWPFATVRASLPINAVAPPFEWDASYTLPPDFIRFKYVFRADSPWKIEGNLLMTNQTGGNTTTFGTPAVNGLPIVYIARVTDPTTFDPLFVEILTLRLALLLGPRISGPNFNQKNLMDELKPLLLEAKTISAQDQSSDELDISTYASARIGYVPYTLGAVPIPELDDLGF